MGMVASDGNLPNQKKKGNGALEFFGAISFVFLWLEINPITLVIVKVGFHPKIPIVVVMGVESNRPYEKESHIHANVYHATH